MLLFAVAAALLGVLWAAIVYAVVALLAAPYTRHARWFAAASGLVVGLFAVGVIAQAPRPFAVADAGASAVATPLGRAVACPETPVPARGIAKGTVDTVATDDGRGVASRAVVGRTTALVFKGWASDTAHAHPLVGVCVLLDGQAPVQEMAIYGVARPDVAQAFHHNDLVGTGFDVRVRLLVVTPGSHAFTVVGVTDGGRVEPIGQPLRLTVE